MKNDSKDINSLVKQNDVINKEISLELRQNILPIKIHNRVKLIDRCKTRLNFLESMDRVQDRDDCLGVIKTGD